MHCMTLVPWAGNKPSFLLSGRLITIDCHLSYLSSFFRVRAGPRRAGAEELDGQDCDHGDVPGAQVCGGRDQGMCDEPSKR